VTYLRKHLKLVTVAAACVTVGAAGSAIATAGAASSSTSTTGTGSSTTAKTPRARGALARARALERRAVHAEVVVATKTGFQTVTLDRGFVQSASGQQLTIREATNSATYKTVTLTIPSGAIVRDNRRASTLSALTPGQRVVVVQASQRAWVIARTAPTP
jgi:hypothetical protein